MMRLPRIPIMLLVTLLLGACASYTESYRERLLATLPSRHDVQFSREQRYPGRVLCGQYSAYAYNGFVRRSQDFVVTPELVLDVPSANQLAVFCTEDPETALYARLGIGGSDADWGSLTKVHDDLTALHDGVLDYYDGAYTPPGSLAELAQGSEAIPESQLIDPWGRPYYYRAGNAGRSLPRPQIYTLGQDGVEGGRGADADIGLEALPLLAHVLRLRGR